VNTVHLYVDAVIAVLIMLTLSVISGFLTAIVTEDRIAIMITMAVVFVATGALLWLRLWLSSPQPTGLNRVER
jgi:hypothetical protein